MQVRNMRTRAIILKKQNTGEYDQLVTCYTEEFGKLAAVAKSVLKPSSIQAMHLDTFNLVDFELLNGRATPIITGAQVENSFPGLKNNLPSLSLAYFFAEVIDRVAFDYQKDENLWEFLVSLFNNLSSRSPASGKLENNDELLRTKQLELLDILGYAPNTDECVFCSRTIGADLAAYNSEAKGVVCKDCFLNGSGGIVVKNKDFLASPVLNGIFESLVERKLNSLNLIRSVLQ